MTNEVLIVAAKPAAKAPAEVIASLRFTPIVANTEKQALDLLARQTFRLIVVSGARLWQRLRDAAERKQPATRLLQLPDVNGDDAALRLLIVRSLEPPVRAAIRSSDERYRFLSGILESFTATLDLREVMRRIVTLTREEFAADRAWLLYPINETVESARVRSSVSAPDSLPINDSDSLPLSRSRGLIRKALASAFPIVLKEGHRDLDPELAKRFQVRSEVVQILRPRDDEPWALGMHASSRVREWTEDEILLFGEIGRYATLALSNALMHDRAMRDIAKANAILDQIPEAAVIYDAHGRLERMNAAATRDSALLLGKAAEDRVRTGKPRSMDGKPLAADDLPSMRALRGEKLKADYVVTDPRTNDDRVINFKAAPIYDERERIIGSVVLSHDVSEERQNAEREAWRRRRAESLANLGLEGLTVQASFDDLGEPARRVAQAIQGTVRISLYHSATGLLELVGYAGTNESEKFRDYFATHPYRPGEGLAGTVFQIGRPLHFYEIRGNAVIDFARDDEERRIKAALHEQSLIAFPIESYGERIGSLVMSQSDPRRNFDAEDLEFARTVAERIGAASHIHRLTRMSQEGHRAAEELARQEVDARVRLEAVLESAPIGVAVISADELRFELANARWMDFVAKFRRLAPDTRLVGMRVDEVTPEFESVVTEVAETGEMRADEELEVSTSESPLYVNRIVSAVRGRFSGVTQSVTVLIQDVTEQVLEERVNRERETRRRRHAECLANIGVEVLTSVENLDEPARRVAEAAGGSAMIFMYQPATGDLPLVGMSSPLPAAAVFRDFLSGNPYRPGEGIPGTVFQIGRPLLFSDVKGNAVVDFGRDDAEKRLIAAMNEQSLIAAPIESYGDRIGAIVVARAQDGRNFDAEDLEFVQAVGERLGAGSHINELTRISQEGHRAAEELARHEVDARVRFEAVLETAPIGVAVISADEIRFEMANARWLEFASHFGKIAPDTRVIGLRVAEVIPGWEQTLKQVAESGELRYDDAYLISARPAPIYVNRIISPVRGRFSGITQSLTVLIQDVTDQVKAKREIEGLAQMMAERSARLDSILGSMTDGLWVYDASGELVDVNQAGLTMFGLGSRTEAISNASFENFQLRYPDGRSIPRDDLPYARALRGMTVPDYLAIGRHLISGKDLDLSIAAAPIESNGIVGAVIVIRDITGLQELDRKKDEFLSVASHELRTPLTTIKGYTQLLTQTIDDLGSADRATYLNAVLGEIERMMGLITELLDVSRIETNRLQIEPQPVRWLEFLERRASAFRVQNPARTITFRAEIPETTMHVDPDRIRQVIDNLLSNAIKYSPEPTEIEVRATLEGGAMLTSVIDHGIGIPTDEIPKLFERFHRARNVSSRYYGGLGLGLYIAKAIVEAHSGSISVQSQEGQGATFTFRLPMR
jgi:PAS domain S-box-containing protein